MEIEKAKYATLGRYILVQNLGAGFNSKVKLGVNTETNQKVAIKILKDVFNKFISNEIETLSKINHPHIVNLIEFLPNVDYVKKNGTVKKVTAIVLELAPGGEIFEFLFRTGRFSEEVSRFFFHNLIESLEYVHGQGYSHRDLKPENLLFGENFVLKVADFGFSTMICGRDGKGFLHTYLGTKGYMAPEIVAKNPYNGVSVDLFAAGVILFIMFTGIPPFPEAQPNDPYYKMIVANKLDIFWMAHSRSKPAGFFSLEFKDLISAMFSYDPAKRPTIEQIKSHPWYNGPVPTEEAVRLEMSQRFAKVSAETEKERAEKKAIALKKKQTAAQRPATLINYPGIASAKGSIDNIEDGGVKELYEEYPALSLQRQAKKYTEDPHGYDYLCPDNALESMILSLYALKSNKAYEIKVSDKSHKIVASIGADSRKVDVCARTFENEDGTSYIRFERMGGDLVHFKKLTTALTYSLNKVTHMGPAIAPEDDAEVESA